MSYYDNIPTYHKLINQFCRREISAELFDKKFCELWMNDRDDEYNKIKSWSYRYDIELQEDLSKGNISTEEFDIKWRNIWGLTDTMSKIQEVLNRIFTACDCFYSDISNEELNPPLVINGDMLREEVLTYLQALENIMK
jgi:hypothetical protein